jgi:hypothetical protein
MTKIQTILAAGLIAAFASPAFAGLDVEGDPLASGRYVSGAPGPVVITHAETAKHMNAFASAHTAPNGESVQFERAVGSIQ